MTSSEAIAISQSSQLTPCGHLDRGTIGQQWIVTDPWAPGDFLPLMFSTGDFPGYVVRRTDFDGDALNIPYYQLT